MTTKIITRFGKARFRVVTPEARNHQLILNFNPLIKQFNLSGNFQLIHWQAKPKGFREWGIYNALDDNYQSLSGFQIQGVFKSLQLPDKTAVSVPSAVLLISSQ